MKTETKMLGIGMTGRNVPKVMSGAKTQTRRIESWLRRLDDIYSHVDKMFDEENGQVWFRFSVSSGDATAYEDVKPRHQIGDRLYVKEALKRSNDEPPYWATYKTDSKAVLDGYDEKRQWESDDANEWKNKVIPARYMPRSAARTFIEITDVRCERIQEIIYLDVVAEGCSFDETDEGEIFRNQNHAYSFHREKFKDLWNDTNGKDAWERNDWVFAYTFKLVEAPQ